ncbi:hypothetical protein H5T87_05310 [bacterium]|nr:hypothetical protein [bacterium]
MSKRFILILIFVCSLGFVQTKEVKVAQAILKADNIEIDWDKNTLSAYPNPVLSLPDSQVQAKRITLYLSQKGTIEKIEAIDDVLFKIVQVLPENIKQEIEGQAKKAVLTGQNLLLLEGEAQAKVSRSDREGTSLIKADKITVDLEKKSLHAQGNVHLEFPLPRTPETATAEGK